VIAAPAAGLEKFSEVFEPRFGESAPARERIAAPCHVELMGHESARKEKNGRRRNRDESIEHDEDMLWKTLTKSSYRARSAPAFDGKP
jgi:hypothetical protein